MIRRWLALPTPLKMIGLAIALALFGWVIVITKGVALLLLIGLVVFIILTFLLTEMLDMLLENYSRRKK